MDVWDSGPWGIPGVLLRCLGGEVTPAAAGRLILLGDAGSVLWEVELIRVSTQQRSSVVLPMDARSLSMQWVHTELGEVSCLELPTHCHSPSLVKVVTSTVIPDFYPVINTNNGSNIPFGDHLGSNKGCN